MSPTRLEKGPSEMSGGSSRVSFALPQRLFVEGGGHGRRESDTSMLVGRDGEKDGEGEKEEVHGRAL